MRGSLVKMGTPEESRLTPLMPLPAKNGNTECEMCEQHPSKYTCPRCQMKTCCLSCVKNHKAQKGCSGVRDKTAYVPIKEFTESHLISDYRLLEDIDRKCYAASGDAKNKPGYLNFRWKLVSRKAAERGVRLRLLPHFFSKHKENSTTFIKKTKVLAWHVKWVFPQSNAEFTDVRLREDVILREALNKYLHPDKADPVVRHRLKKYCSKGIAGIKVYMKVEDRPANTIRYHSLVLDKTLGDNLKGKIVVEYPTIHVALPDSTDQYHLLEQESEDQSHVGVQDSLQALKKMEHDREDGADFSEETKSHQTDSSISQSWKLMEQEREGSEADEAPEEVSSYQTESSR